VSVRTITAKRASGPVRYLLSADRTLRKLSLKRLPSARTLTRRRRRSIRPTHAVPSGTVHTHTSRNLTSLTFFAIMFLTVGVALIAARARLEPARPDVEDVANTPANALDVAEPVQSAPPVVLQASTDGSKTRASAPLTATPPAAHLATVTAPAAHPATAPEVVHSSKPRQESGATPQVLPTLTAVETVPPGQSARTLDVETAPPVTIVGCLESTSDTFWLTNASGTGVPTSRSWKTVFLRKHTPSMAIVDATQLLDLQGHVGQRVAVTGTVSDRAIHTRALELVSASCN